MSVLSKLKRGVITFGLVTALAATAVTPVFASETTIEATNSFEVSVNDIIDGVDGKEKVVFVFDDGRYATIPLKDTEVFATCPHTNIVGMGTKHKETSSYNKSDSTYCYKYRYYEDARCAQCGKKGYKIYDKSWTKVKHKYKIFGDTCTVCGYVK